ncbi:hypothetical protein NL676_026218 [Syzygium grande]|nr:hypothetical protein NL676_026218 [Syzygium grande]
MITRSWAVGLACTRHDWRSSAPRIYLSLKRASSTAPQWDENEMRRHPEDAVLVCGTGQTQLGVSVSQCFRQAGFYFLVMRVSTNLKLWSIIRSSSEAAFLQHPMFLSPPS